MLRIALKMLVGDRVKYFGLIGGFFFTALMITQMTSLFVGMMSRSFTLVAETTNVDIWAMDPAVETVGEAAPMREATLNRVRGVVGVDYVMPMYVGNIRARLPSGRFVNSELIGIDASTMLGAPYSNRFDWSVLRRSDAIVIDRRSAINFFMDPFARSSPVETPPPLRPIRAGDIITLNDRRAIVAGIADAGARMIAKPVIYTTYDRAVSWSPRQTNMLTYALIRAKPGVDLQTLCTRINADTGLRARTCRELSLDSVRYTIQHTDIIKQVGFMVALTTAVGIVVTGLLLNMFISDNLRYFAVLKAMGLGNARIVSMLYVQTLWCGLIGCTTGMGTACVLGTVMKRVNMPFVLLWQPATGIPILIICLCLVTAAYASRRVIRLEPAIVFQT